MTAPEAAASLPKLVSVGITWNDRYVAGPLACWTPIAGNGVKGKIFNLHSYSPNQKLPDRFILGDGGFAPFRAVDKTPGTPLHKLIVAAAADAKSMLGIKATCDYLKDPSRRYAMAFAKVPLGIRKLPQKQLDFLGTLPSYPNIGDVVSTPFTLPIHDFALTAERRQGVCMDQALWNTLVLQELGIPCKLESGRMVDSQTSGHSWVRLGDGRILDGEGGLYRPVPGPVPNSFARGERGLAYFTHPAWGFFVLDP